MLQDIIREMLSHNNNFPVVIKMSLHTENVNIGGRHIKIEYDNKSIEVDKNATKYILMLAFLDNNNNIYLSMGDASDWG